MDELITYSQNYTDLPNDPTVDLTFDQGSIEASSIEIEILGLLEEPSVKIHIRELTLH